MEKNSFEIKKGDKFMYNGYTFIATADATGEFATRVKVYDTMFAEESEVLLPSGSVVLVVD